MSRSLLTYDSYIGVHELIALANPTTAADDRPGWAAERFFIVEHQISELLASQVLTDLDVAAERAGCGDWYRAAVSIERAAALVATLLRVLADLRRLPVTDFLAFRDQLDGASGADSRQVATLLAIRRLPAVHELRRAAAVAGCAGNGRFPPGADRCPVCRTEQGLAGLVSGVRRWRALHVQIAQHFIGTGHGTGGSNGVPHLLDRARADDRAARAADGPTADGGGRRLTQRCTAS